MPTLYDDSMLLTEARARVDRLKPLLEPPDQQALDVLTGRLDDLERLADVARQARKAQRQYFRDRTGLDQCKALESRLDGMIKE